MSYRLSDQDRRFLEGNLDILSRDYRAMALAMFSYKALQDFRLAYGGSAPPGRGIYSCKACGASWEGGETIDSDTLLGHFEHNRGCPAHNSWGMITRIREMLQTVSDLAPSGAEGHGIANSPVDPVNPINALPYDHNPYDTEDDSE
jgi:hypothetical protein